MTDIEKEATEYALEWGDKTDGTYASCKDGYIAGAKAHQTQWTEIENKTTPNREISKKYIPAHKRKVLLKYHFINEEEIHISDGYFDDYDHTFHIPNNPTCRIVYVIAWAEFEE